VQSGGKHVGYVPINTAVQISATGRFPGGLAGVWLTSDERCRAYYRSMATGEAFGDELFEVTSAGLREHEASSTVVGAKEVRPHVWDVELYSIGEGEEWLSRLRLELIGDRLRTSRDGRSVDRVRCAVSRHSDPAVREPRPGDYPAGVYRGPISLPDFRGRDRGHAMFRTRLRDGLKQGPNVAGYLVIIPIGCGTGCLFLPVVDVRTGRVFAFPTSGEDYPYIAVSHRLDSNLVKVQWESDARCMKAFYLWSGTSFERHSGPEMIRADRCPLH
jgi:hypothetical protein